MRVSYLTTVTDNQQLQYTVAAATANASGSSFGAANAGGASSSIIGDRNRIEVTADRLAFVQQPVNTPQNASMTASPTVKASDVNGNIDLDYTAAIAITSTGTMTGAPISVTPTTGVSTFSGIVHTTSGTYTLGATSGSLTGATSNSFIISAFTYAAGDFRPLYVTDLSYNGDWEYLDGATWRSVAGGSWDGKAPQNTTNFINRVLIDKYVTGGGSNAKAYNCDFIIQSGGELVLLANDAPPVAAEMLATNKKIEVLLEGKLTIQGDIDVASTSKLIVRNGGTMTLDQNSINNAHPMWDGVELFEGGSTVVIKDWDWSASATNRSIVNINDTNITNNTNGYKFGNLILDVNSVTTDWTLIGGPVGIINLCENDFDVSNVSTTNYILGASNSSGTNGFLVNGNMTIYDGNFSFGANFSNTSFNHQFTINGNFECGSNDNLKIHYNSFGTLTNNLSGNVTFKGDVKIASTVASFTNDGGTTAGNTRMSVNFEGGTLASPKMIDIAPTAVAIPMNIKATSFRILATQDLTTNSVTSYTAPFTVETGGTLHFGWAANGITPLVIKKATSSAGTNSFASQTNSTLIITSLDGIQNASATLGNVQYASSNKTFNQTAIFWYVGKSNQITGDGITTGGSAKTIICELLDNTKTLTLSNSTSITTPGLLNIKKGKVTEDATNYITGSTGGLTMDAGTLYSIARNSATSSDVIPRLDGLMNVYNLVANSTIELNGTNGPDAFDQYLRGGRDYKNLTFSNSGVKTISSATTSVVGTILVSDSAILDVEAKSMGGTGTNLTMAGTSEYRTAGTGVKPDASGIYTLGTGTKVTFTSGSVLVPISTLEQIRLAPNYYNIDIVGNNVGTDTTTGAIKIKAGGTFAVKPTGIFKHSNTAGFNGSTTTAIDNTNAPTITLDTDSTVEYAGADQTISLFNAPYYTNLKISGTGVKTLQNPLLTEVNEDLNVVVSKLLVDSNEAISVKQAVVVAATGAEFEIKNNGILYQDDDTGVNSGNIIMRRDANIRLQDYVYWSSPIDEFTAQNISPITPANVIWKWDPRASNPNGAFGNWINCASEVMEKGKGYIVRGPSGYSFSVPTTFSATFQNAIANKAKPNNGIINQRLYRGPMQAANIGDYTSANGISFSVNDDNSNLVGNPYPSAISVSSFLAYNADPSGPNPVIEGSVRIWSHTNLPTSTTNPFYNSYQYNYFDDYIVHDGTGTVSGPTTFNGFIGAGQGFFVLMNDGPKTEDADGSINLVFNNGMRVKSSNSNSQFFKSANATVVASEDKHRIWLDLVSSTGSVVRTLVGYVPNATLEKDVMYDAFTRLDGTQNFYSVIGDAKVCIQGRPVPFDNTDLVPLGVSIPTTGTYTIAIAFVDGLFSDATQDIFVEDKVLNTIHNLRQAPYSFTTATGIVNDRFVLRYTNQTLGNNNFELNQNVVVATQNHQLSITSQVEKMKSVVVYDMLGREIANKQNFNNNDVVLTNIMARNQALIVKITLENGVVETRKIIL